MFNIISWYWQSVHTIKVFHVPAERSFEVIRSHLIYFLKIMNIAISSLLLSKIKLIIFFKGDGRWVIFSNAWITLAGRISCDLWVFFYSKTESISVIFDHNVDHDFSHFRIFIKNALFWSLFDISQFHSKYIWTVTLVA